MNISKQVIVFVTFELMYPLIFLVFWLQIAKKILQLLKRRGETMKENNPRTNSRYLITLEHFINSYDQSWVAYNTGIARTTIKYVRNFLQLPCTDIDNTSYNKACEYIKTNEKKKTIDEFDISYSKLLDTITVYNLYSDKLLADYSSLCIISLMFAKYLLDSHLSDTKRKNIIQVITNTNNNYKSKKAKIDFSLKDIKDFYFYILFSEDIWLTFKYETQYEKKKTLDYLTTFTNTFFAWLYCMEYNPKKFENDLLIFNKALYQPKYLPSIEYYKECLIDEDCFDAEILKEFTSASYENLLNNQLEKKRKN